MSDEAQALIAQSVIDQASKLGLTVGCAESLTGGLVSSRLVEIPGASAVFRGGIVAYDSMLKNDVLGVDASTLASTGAVTAEVASAMAEGALSRLGVDVAVATTGVAGPDPDPVSGEAPGQWLLRSPVGRSAPWCGSCLSRGTAQRFVSVQPGRLFRLLWTGFQPGNNLSGSMVTLSKTTAFSGGYPGNVSISCPQVEIEGGAPWC